MRILRPSFALAAAALAAACVVPVLSGAQAPGTAGAESMVPGYGPLQSDPDGMLALPKGFQYRTFSTAMLNQVGDPRFSQKLDNGEPVPARHDGMGAFQGQNGMTILVRNHELEPWQRPSVDALRRRPYDPQGTGGTTTLWLDRDRNLVRAFPSLSGTVNNCSGGPTPWGSWLSCEECVYMPGKRDAQNFDRRPDVTRPHGYVFEVGAHALDLVDPEPIHGMGRFYHEAAAVDPETGNVYLTEDREDGLLYRYVPTAVSSGETRPRDMRVGDLAKGGVLEALRVTGQPSLFTQNWNDSLPAIPAGAVFAVDWVRIPKPEPDMDEEVATPPEEESPADSAATDSLPPEPSYKAPPPRRPRTAPTSTRAQGFTRGCAQFGRPEGIAYQRGAVYMSCTSGGRARCGQVWRLDLERQELTLLVEAPNRGVMDGPDNLCAAPNGDLIVCEDGEGVDRVLGLTPEGRLYEIARNVYNDEEFTGACFSPDKRTLFVNIQEPGITFAVWGPWNRRDD